MLETGFLLLAAGVAWLHQGPDMPVLLISAGWMLVAGLLFYVIGRKADEHHAGRREGILTISLTWIILSLFGMVPFLAGGYITSFSDAFFETMSGFTTTGMSVFDDVEQLPEGILFWRSLMQWQGGVGVVVFTIALLPLFGGGALQLFDAEMPGFSNERFLPRVAQVAKWLSGVYLIITLFFALLLWIGPMDFFDAVNHAMAGISTGGYSTKNASIAYWDSAYTEYVMIACIGVGGMKLPLFFFALKGNIKPLRHDEETRWYLLYMLVFIAITLVGLFLLHFEAGSSVEKMIRQAIFFVVSLATSTGYKTADYQFWGNFYLLLALFLMLTCGCRGSTSGGIKIGRVMIMLKNVYNEFRKQTHPAAIFPVRVSGHAISQDIISRVHVFIIVYFLLIGFSWLVLILCGLSFDGALYTSISAIGNVGFWSASFGDGSIQSLPVVTKWFLSFIMMTGRLELFTVLTLLLPNFWRTR